LGEELEEVLFLIMEAELRSAFFDLRKSNIAYTSVSKLIQKFSNKYSADKIKKWAQDQLTVQLHKPLRHNFKRNYTLCHAPFEFIFSDLIILSNLKRHNGGVSNVLVVIDCLSRFAFVEPLVSKKSSEVSQKLEVIIKKINNHIIKYIVTDGGGEYQKTCQELFKKHSMKHIVTKNEKTKAMLAERFIQTLMGSLSKYMTENNTKKYVDVLQMFCNNYNQRVHSSIGQAPEVVLESLENQKKAFRFQYEKKLEEKFKAPNFKIGDIVRMAYYKNSTFEKGYTENYSHEIFRIKKVLPRKQPVYELTTLEGESVVGRFYEQEILPATEPEFYKISRVVRWRGSKEKREALVDFIGHPPSARQWVKESDIKDLI
jgi:hypothetical protein